jgi:hypothetical protein
MRSTIFIAAVFCVSCSCSDSKFQNPVAPTERSAQPATESTSRRRAVTQPATRAALSGTWGGEHVTLELQDQGGGRIEFDCAHGSITQAIIPRSDGTFSATGTFTRELGHPVAGDTDDAHPARYSGTVSGTKMELTIAVDGQELPNRFELEKDQEGRLVKCL